MEEKIIKSDLPEWMEKIDLEDIEKLASLGYTPEKIAMYYKIPKNAFMVFFMCPDSILKYHYDRGQLIQEANEGMAMIDQALVNTTQAQRLDKLREKIEFKNARDKIMYGGF